MRFELDAFIADVRAALGDPSPQQAVREVLKRVVSDSRAVMEGLGEPSRGQVERLYNAEDLTILKVILAPQMVFLPHNHRMWAVVGIFTGREDNIFWRRTGDGRIEAAGAHSLGPGEVIPLGPEIIHSVANPVAGLTAGIHIYGGDFFGVQKSEWDPRTLREHPYDVEKNMALFERANAILETA